MKGVVFNILEEFIVTHSDEATYEEIFASCPLHSHKGYVGPGTYPDTDLMSIVAKTCERLGLEVDQAVELFGEFMFPRLAGKHPGFLSGHTDSLEFLKSVDEVIHVEVRKLMRDTNLPSIKCVDGEESNSLNITYQSERQLCRLMKGLIKGVGTHFEENLVVVETVCTRDGETACQFSVKKPAGSEQVSDLVEAVHE